MLPASFDHDVLSRFLRYVKINTQSDPFSTSFPSTLCQKDLSRLLVEELLEIGLLDAHLDEFGYVYATLPSNIDKIVPVICFCAHVDTSPDAPGENVVPVVHANYNGGKLIFPDNPSLFISPENEPDLSNQIGNDIITASGLTLLGADNKAGVAAIMNAINILVSNPSIPHGTIKVLFTPDEEIGKGVNFVNLEKLGADFAYTIDGERKGTIEDETFSADSVEIIFKGVSAHPGFAFGKMQNSIKMAGMFLDLLPKDKLSPETTKEKEGFVHPVHIAGKSESTTVQLIVRDFELNGLLEKEKDIQNLVNKVLESFPDSSAEITITEQYRNMKEVFKKYPFITDYAVKAIKNIGINPVKSYIRGGTDGARLSFMGLPCPNLFAGEHAFHSLKEWVSVQDMEKSSEMIIHLAAIWANHEN
jgi:tripeptide aminopeptidase